MTTGTTFDDLVNNALAALETEALPLVEPTEEEIVAAGKAMIEAGWRPTDRGAFEALCRYFAGPRRHGLLLSGAPGVGKTYLVKTVLNLRPVRARDIVTAYVQEREYNAAFWYRVGGGWDCEQLDGLVVDDLGEEATAVVFGQKEEVLANVLIERHLWWQRSGGAIRTYVTTNLSAAELDGRYGRRVLDRLGEMCVPIRFQGTSQRSRAKTVPAGPQAGTSREVIR